MIAPVDQPTNSISNIITVWKMDKKQVQICLDPIDLNKVIHRNHFKMPTIDDILPNLKDTKAVQSAGHQGSVITNESVRKKLLSDYILGSKGVSSAPEEFQRRLQHALHGLTGVAVAADDVLVYSVGETMEEARLNHDENLLELLHRAREH